MIEEIKIVKLRKSYSSENEALKGVDLVINKGHLFALLGPNGAGKSTLVKILTTLEHKDSGEFEIHGINPETNFSAIQRLIGVASQENEIDPAEKVSNLLEFQAQLFGCSKKHAKIRSEELLELFQLTLESNKKAGNLSGGNKRRLHCALALVHHPKILFLDEPTVGMDPLARENFWKVITNLNKKEEVTVLLTTQYLEEADKFATDMAFLIEGQIQYYGSVPAFKQMVHPDSNRSLEESYLTFIKSFTK